MRDFSFTVAFLLPAKARKTKNFRQLLKYARDLGFRTLLSDCIKNTRILLRIGKPRCNPMEVANLFIALHLLTTQRKEDLIMVGTVDQAKYQHCLFATLSIEKMRNWTGHLMARLAGKTSYQESPLPAPLVASESAVTSRTEASDPAVKKPMHVELSDTEPRVLH